MQFDTANLIAVLPELFILVMACVVLLVDLSLKQEQRDVTYSLTQATLVVAAGLTLYLSGGERQVAFDGNYYRDGLSDMLKLALYVVTFVAFVYGRDDLKNRGLYHGEYFMLGLFALLGMMIIVSAGSFISAYLGLELLALSLYAMVAFDRNSPKGSEAAMKYFVLGALASGMLLYGISMVYGVTGSVQFEAVAQSLNAEGSNRVVLVFGLVFIVIGVAFKFGAVPFHMWVPDVYHGAPTSVTLFLGSVPKIAAFALAMRLLVDGMGGMARDWQQMLIILSVLSMGIGNLIAIAQSNIKRMLAYSTISHVGFIFLGILAGTRDGYIAAMFYAIAYALMAVGGFGMLVLLSRRGFDAENLDDLKGLNDRSPWFAAMMLLFMFSMAGVPPMVGFFAKLLVLKAVLDIGLVWLAVVGVLFSLIGAFYYLRVVKMMYFDKPLGEEAITASPDARIMLSINGLAMLLLGMFPAALLVLCTTAFH